MSQQGGQGAVFGIVQVVGVGVPDGHPEEADPRATDFQDKTALIRGPLVYCFEGVDNPDHSVRTIGVTAGKKMRPFQEGIEPESLYQAGAEIARFAAVDKPDLLGGVTVLRRPGDDDHSSEITAVPYFAWANRGLSPMRIWIDASA